MSETETTAVVEYTPITENHVNIADLFISKVRSMLKSEAAILKYGVDNEYSFQATESISLKIDDKNTLSVQWITKK